MSDEDSRVLTTCRVWRDDLPRLDRLRGLMESEAARRAGLSAAAVRFTRQDVLRMLITQRLEEVLAGEPREETDHGRRTPSASRDLAEAAR